MYCWKRFIRKSTILKTIIGLKEISSGTIKINNIQINEKRGLIL